MKTLAIANHKGGVGKTATVHALGESLAFDHGRRVLLVDNDAQASLTAACGVRETHASLAEVLGETGPEKPGLREVLLEIGPNLMLAPADIALAPVEMGLHDRSGRAALLKDVLTPIQADFDVAIIDCAPYLGLLTMNALAAADAVLIPTQAQAVDLRGLVLFLEAIRQIQESLNPALEILGILATFYDNRFIHHRAALEEMEAAGLPVLEVRIGRSVRVAEAALQAKSIVTSDPNNPQAVNYRKLAVLVEGWLG